MTPLEIKQTVEEWRTTVLPVIDSKVNELIVMGYSKVNREEVWSCLKKKVWKGNPEKRLHEVVQDILHLRPHVYMSYLTMNAYQDDDLMASIQALTNPNHNKFESDAEEDNE